MVYSYEKGIADDAYNMKKPVINNVKRQETPWQALRMSLGKRAL